MLNTLHRTLFPHLCISCGDRMHSTHEFLCMRCEMRLTHSLMPSGLQPLEPVFWGRLMLHGAYSNYFFTRGSTVQELMHTLKYGGDPRVAHHFGKRFGASLVRLEQPPQLDMIVPVPLHPKKERIRGFNQAYMLARGMSDATGIPVSTALQRTEHRQSLTRLNRMARWQQSERLYQLLPEKLEGKRIMLVDDVVTTGATLDICGSLMMAAEPAALYVGALAQTKKF